jgi:hypothetical protein
LDAVDWSSRPHTPQKLANKTSAKVEREICALRKKLETQGALGFTGALTIHDALQGSNVPEPLPSVRTSILSEGFTKQVSKVISDQ